ASGAEEAFVKAFAVDPENIDIMRSLEELRRAPGRERDLVATLRARAKLENDPPTRRELLREAKTLAEGTVNDIPLAEEVLRELLEDDEADMWALEELTKLRQNAGDSKEVVALLLRRAELANEPEATEL